MGAAILWENLADSGTVSASSGLASAPATSLQNEHTTRRWKGRNGASESILCTWADAQDFNSISLERCAEVTAGVLSPMSSAATIRVRVSSADLTGVAGDVWDSGTLSGRVREEYGRFVDLHEATLTGKALLIDIGQSGADAILAGRLVVGMRQAFDYNFSYGWTDGYGDLSRIRKSAGGQTFIDRDLRYRVLGIEFGAVSQADRNAIVREVDRVSGISRDVLFVIDEDSAEPDRDSVWGLIKDMSPPSQPNLAWFSKRYDIEERL